MNQKDYMELSEDGRTLIRCDKNAEGKIRIPYGVTKIGLACFFPCSKISSIEIPSSVTEISDCSFSDCTGLKEIVTDEKNPVFRSEDGVLYSKDLSRLIAVPRCKDSIQIPESVIEIGDWAFYGCSNLTSVDIPNGVKMIGQYAFSGCTSLISVEIPNGVTKLGDSAFSDCTSLTYIEIPGSVTEIGINVFSGCSRVKKYVVNTDNPIYCSFDGAIYTKGMKDLIRVPGIIGSFNIPGSATRIKDGAFDGCTSLTSIDIPDGVSEI